MTWSHALRALMVRYAAGNAFATAKPLRFVDDNTTMLEVQWDILRWRYFSGAEFNNTSPTTAVPTVHAQERLASRLCLEGVPLLLRRARLRWYDELLGLNRAIILHEFNDKRG